jgi:hypothetical protein
MARIDELPPDQRAALQLLLKQGRSYDEIAQLLRIEPSAVRERARAALDALGPDDVDGLSLERQDDVADYLLGQQSASLRASTRAFLEESAPGRAWARVVAGELRAGGHGFGDNLPEIPAEAAEVDEAFDALNARTAHREKTERSSRVGGAILLVGLGLALVLAVLLITGAFSGDDDEGGGSASTGTQTSQTQAGEPQVEAQINLTKPEGQSGNAAGVAQVARQGGQRAVALVAQGLPRATRNRFYAIWLYTSPTKAKFLGFPNPQPDQNGRIETGFGLPNDANQYERLVVTRETQERPKQPGTIVLGGALELPR